MRSNAQTKLHEKLSRLLDCSKVDRLKPCTHHIPIVHVVRVQPLGHLHKLVGVRDAQRRRSGSHGGIGPGSHATQTVRGTDMLKAETQQGPRKHSIFPRNLAEQGVGIRSSRSCWADLSGPWVPSQSKRTRSSCKPVEQNHHFEERLKTKQFGCSMANADGMLRNFRRAILSGIIDIRSEKELEPRKHTGQPHEVQNEVDKKFS